MGQESRERRSGRHRQLQTPVGLVENKREVFGVVASSSLSDNSVEKVNKLVWGILSALYHRESDVMAENIVPWKVSVTTKSAL